MKIDLRCIPCNLNSLLRILDQNHAGEEEKKQVVRTFMKEVAEMDWSDTPIDIGRKVGEVLEPLFGDSDAFRDIKKMSNDNLLEIYDDLKTELLKLDDPLIGALKLSVAGNIIDVAPGHKIDIHSTMKDALSRPFAIDDLQELADRIRKANSLLIVGDNCGEAVLDKLLLDIAKVPNSYFSVRTKPALNDITMKEALEISMDEVATLMDSGADAPGAQEKTMKRAFSEVYFSADVVISKGQGNLEGLSSVKREIFFLLMAKCEVIGGFLGVPKGSFVAYKKAESRG
ncbi:ARMT1-like domain-containing protein [Mesotoga prima]|uniref:damage-control phosphatase ARMT1 family protein n=1 Tax=Mesotoga prima TaxID=1184387 RepID=UPI002C2A7563|nr:ARMT1-like domain-containing protein [Mesotoga prima]HPA00337.1 ARMT1-like domain-containing protein [Mesotoga prima]